jgi:outer membrane protein TolC
MLHWLIAAVVVPGPVEPELALTPGEAVLLALENNSELAMERLTPAIMETYVQEQRGAFDGFLALELGREKVRGRDLSSGGVLFDYETDSPVGDLILTQPFSTGTALELRATTEVSDQSRDGQQLVESRVGLRVTQPVLKDAGGVAGRARIRAARADVLASQYELRGFTELLVSLVEATYWDLASAERQIEIYTESVGLADTLRTEIDARVGMGIVARNQLAAAAAEVALRRQELVDVEAARQSARILLLGYLDLPDQGLGSDRVRLLEKLEMPAEAPESVESHVFAGVQGRPDLNQARALVERGRLEVVRTRNGLLPRLDLFAELGGTGYASSFSRAWNDLDGDHWDVRFGISLVTFLPNREERADHAREVVSRTQVEESVRNLERLVEVDVRTAHVEAQRARAKVTAVGATRALDEEKLRIEAERFDLAQASSFQVARAQRDLVRRQIDEAIAIAEYRKALVELYRLDGSLLKRRGIVVPGERPPEDQAE